MPALRGFLGWVRKPSSWLFRIPLGFVLVLGGILSILPILGLWMLPLGLLLLAFDVPFLRRPLNLALILGQRRWTLWRRSRRKAPA